LVLGYLFFSSPSRAEIIFENCLLKPTYENGTIFKIYLEKKIVRFKTAKGGHGILNIDKHYGNIIYTGEVRKFPNGKQDVLDNFNKNFNFLHFFNIEAKTLKITLFPKGNASRKSLRFYKKGLKDGSIDEQVQSICKVTDVYKEIEAKIEEERKRQAAIAAEAAKKWVKKNKPILLKKVKAKINEYDKKIKKINVDFDRLDAALKQYLNTFDFAKDGVEETFNITGNKSNKDIKEKLKLLTQKKKSLLNESKITNFELEYEEIFERIGTLKELDNYKNIIKLKKKIDQETKSKNKIKGYEEDFKSLKSKKLGSNKLKDDIVQLNEKITKEENLIKSSVISLKEEIDILDAELSEKDPFDVVIRIAIYVIIFLIVLGLIVYLILQNRKMNQMNLASRSNESKFGKLEDQIKDNAEKMRRAQHTRSRQEKTTLSSVPPQPKEPPKTPEEITFGKYEEMIENYKEALDNFSKVAAFKQKWSGLALTRKERQDGTKTVLINSSRAFEKSEIWCMNFDDRYFALPGSSVKSNMAAYMNLDFEKAQRDFKGVFNITSGSNYFTEVALLRRGGAGFVVEKIGKLQFPQ